MAEPVSPVRTDIQALRGLAVLLVVLYHVQVGPFNAGYLGVDIFFVISGYLITSLVARGIERGDFRFKDFYFRRAKRLLPAAYVTICVTALLSPWFLNQQELTDFALQVVGALSFTANVVLWQQTGYFEGASELKPLLHMWSLSLEEQYYLLLPAALLLLRRPFWLRAIIFALGLSVALCVVGGWFKPVATFYLLPTRAWELLMGSAGALLVRREGGEERVATSRLIRTLFLPSLIGLMLLPLHPLGWGHPGPMAGLVCVATAVVILRRREHLERVLLIRALARVGDVSYSLYLVHWPIVALLKNAWVGPDAELPFGLRLTALILSFAAALLLYRLVEDPVRRSGWRYSPRLLAAACASSLVLVVIAPIAMLMGRPSLDFQVLRRVNMGLGETCESTADFRPRPECRSGEQAKIVVWGDSYAMHLIPGLAAQAETGGVIQATRSTCGPLLGLGPQRLINPAHSPVYDRDWAESCIRFNASVLAFIQQERAIEIVVLSSPLTQYVDKGRWVHVTPTAQGRTVTDASEDGALRALVRSAAAARAAGKRVVFFAPPPAADFNVGACLERQSTKRISIGGQVDCVIPASIYRAARAKERSLVDRIEKAGIPVVRISEFLCTESLCQTSLEGTMIYRDEGHLSYAGSRLLADRMGWAALIHRNAR